MEKNKKNKKEEKGLIKPRKRVKSLQKKLIQMQIADGKLYNKRGVKSIDELLGISSNKYLTRDETRYENYISNLNTSDLQTHATQVGVLPNQDRSVTIKRLLKEFRIHNSGFLNTAEAVNPIKKKIRQETIDILAEGR
jgi:hypothetical protein